MLSSDKNMRAVCHFDQALDLSPDERVKYAHERPDASTLKVIPGQTPTVFHVRPISRSMMKFCDRAGDDTDKAWRAFISGVERVTNVVRADGTFAASVEPTGVVPGSDVRIWKDDELEMFDYCAIIEIGAVAFAHSFFPRSIERRYPLLPSSPLVLAALDRRHAEKSQGDAHKSNAKPSEAATIAPVPSGDAPTDATAMG